MELAVHLAQTLARDLGVDLRGRDVGMAEHGLHRAQVGAAFEEMRGEGMPQAMRADLGKTENEGPPAEQLPKSLARHWPAARRDEHVRARAAAQEQRTALAEVGAERLARRRTDRHRALLVAFADD